MAFFLQVVLLLCVLMVFALQTFTFKLLLMICLLYNVSDGNDLLN